MPEWLVVVLAAILPKVIEKVFERALDRYWPLKKELPSKNPNPKE